MANRRISDAELEEVLLVEAGLMMVADAFQTLSLMDSFLTLFSRLELRRECRDHQAHIEHVCARTNIYQKFVPAKDYSFLDVICSCGQVGEVVLHSLTASFYTVPWLYYSSGEEGWCGEQ